MEEGHRHQKYSEPHLTSAHPDSSYAAMKELLAISETSDPVYPYIVKALKPKAENYKFHLGAASLELIACGAMMGEYILYYRG